MQNVFISIGIEYKESGTLRRLKGAVPSAEALHSWAESQEYASKCITDKETDVTAGRVRDAIESLIGQGGQERVIIAFAGHGLIRDGAEELWLLNDWQAAIGAINHSRLRERLKSYGVKQIAIINDACRNLVSDDFRDVNGSPVIRIKDYERNYVETAVINGTKTGHSSYATPSNNKKQYCFLSWTLFETLSDINSTWSDKPELRHGDLYNILLKKVPEIAAEFRAEQYPQPEGIFLDPKDIWSDRSKIPSNLTVTRPNFPSGTTRSGAATALSVLSNNSNLKSLDLADFNKINRSDTMPSEISKNAVSSISSRIAKKQDFRRNGFSMGGINADELYTDRKLRKSKKHGVASPCIIRLENGEWCGAAIYKNLPSNFVYSGEGVLSLSMGETSELEENPLFEEIFAALSGFGFSEAIESAAIMRQDKHLNPVLGVISAYTYYRVGAIDDIRKTAYYYDKHRQALPFDIALLADIKITESRHGYLAHVPAVGSRAPITEAEKKRPYTYKGTKEVIVPIAGKFPWLRQGWELSEDNRNGLIRELSEFKFGLKRSLFSTFQPDLGPQLIEYFNSV